MNVKNKYDCSKALDFAHEESRLCKSFSKGCDDGCPLKNVGCDNSMDITQERINVVQNWSDSNPERTRLYHFLKQFQNAKTVDGEFIDICPKVINSVYLTALECKASVCEECKKLYWSEVV